jgi:hypothetical protein
MKRTWKIVAVCGGLALVIVACGSDRRAVRMFADAMVDAGTVLSDAASEDAAAQPSACAAWEISIWDAFEDPTCDTSARINDGASCAVPAGWEPLYPEGTTRIWLRRCVR